MKVLSLFSGVGGFDLGLENAGMETVFQCEWDKHATSILQRHWPDVPRWGDITTLTGRHILDHAPVIDVVAWGSPCQDLSVAGKRAGLSGQRSGLFHEGIRIIKELRKETNNAYPRISIWENVYGALNSNKGADFGLVLDEMAEAGAMVIEWRVLDAQYFGVPQRRRRVFVVAIFDPRIAANCPDPLLPLRQGVRWNPATSRTTRQQSAETVESSSSSSCSQLTYTKAKRAQSTTDNETWVEGKPAPTLNAFDQGDVRATTAIVFENSYRDSARIAEDGITQTLSAKMGTGGGNTPMVAFATNQRAEVRELGDKAVALSAEPGTNQQTYVAIGIQGNVIGRQDHNGPAGKGHTDEGDPMFTLNTTDHHAVATTMSVRRLTPLECERLMGWPDDWTAGQADTHRYKQCGNGVASPVAQWIGEQILNIPQ